MTLQIDVPIDEIVALCKQYPVRKLSLFGSVLREDFRTDSDIDMLVEFQPEARVGYFTMGKLQVDLTELLGREVDLKTAEDLSQYFRHEVIEKAQQIYERE
jgi:uncharacterized protein